MQTESLRLSIGSIIVDVNLVFTSTHSASVARSKLESERFMSDFNAQFGVTSITNITDTSVVLTPRPPPFFQPFPPYSSLVLSPFPTSPPPVPRIPPPVSPPPSFPVDAHLYFLNLSTTFDNAVARCRALGENSYLPYVQNIDMYALLHDQSSRLGVNLWVGIETSLVNSQVQARWSQTYDVFTNQVVTDSFVNTSAFSDCYNTSRCSSCTVSDMCWAERESFNDTEYAVYMSVETGTLRSISTTEHAHILCVFASVRPPNPPFDEPFAPGVPKPSPPPPPPPYNPPHPPISPLVTPFPPPPPIPPPTLQPIHYNTSSIESFTVNRMMSDLMSSCDARFHKTSITPFSSSGIQVDNFVCRPHGGIVSSCITFGPIQHCTVQYEYETHEISMTQDATIQLGLADGIAKYLFVNDVLTIGCPNTRIACCSVSDQCILHNDYKFVIWMYTTDTVPENIVIQYLPNEQLFTIDINSDVLELSCGDHLIVTMGTLYDITVPDDTPSIRINSTNCASCTVVITEQQPVMHTFDNDQFITPLDAPDCHVNVRFFTPLHHLPLHPLCCTMHAT